MKKIITVLCVALLCCMVLTACSSPVTFQTSGASYDVAEITSSNEVSGMAPGSGNTFLVVKLGTAENSLDDAQASFLPAGGTPSYVTDGTTLYPCKAIAFQSDGSRVQTVLVYEVPLDWANAKEFSLGGNDFSPVALKK